MPQKIRCVCFSLQYLTIIDIKNLPIFDVFKNLIKCHGECKTV